MFRIMGKHFRSGFHPLAVVLFIGLVVAIGVSTDHPLILLVILVAMLMHCMFEKVYKRLITTLRFSIGMAVLFVLINPLLSHFGQTVLWRGPHIPVFGRLRVTVEALAYGADMGLRFITILLAVLVYTAWMEGDQLYAILRRIGSKSSITLSLATRMMPHMTEQVQHVTEVMRVRGVQMRNGSILARAKGHFPLLKVLLVEALEGAWDVAEAMQARAFGAAKATRYKRNHWSMLDSLLVLDSCVLILIYVLMRVHQVTSYSFYPKLSPLVVDGESIVLFGLLFVCLILPGIVKYVRARS